MNNQLNKEVLKDVIAEVLETIQLNENTNGRWIKAVKRAAVEIEDNPFIHFDLDNNHLILWSQYSNEIYEANGICRCKAFQKGFPCYHRAAARIIQRHYERTNNIRYTKGLPKQQLW